MMGLEQDKARLESEMAQYRALKLEANAQDLASRVARLQGDIAEDSATLNALRGSADDLFTTLRAVLDRDEGAQWVASEAALLGSIKHSLDRMGLGRHWLPSLALLAPSPPITPQPRMQPVPVTMPMAMAPTLTNAAPGPSVPHAHPHTHPHPHPPHHARAPQVPGQGQIRPHATSPAPPMQVQRSSPVPAPVSAPVPAPAPAPAPATKFSWATRGPAARGKSFLEIQAEEKERLKEKEKQLKDQQEKAAAEAAAAQEAASQAQAQHDAGSSETKATSGGAGGGSGSKPKSSPKAPPGEAASDLPVDETQIFGASEPGVEDTATDTVAAYSGKNPMSAVNGLNGEGPHAAAADDDEVDGAGGPEEDGGVAKPLEAQDAMTLEKLGGHLDVLEGSGEEVVAGED
jgi:hypothetical protein